ncbi:MAG TPA: CopG family antitoxin [bacterium]|nr:CopG family antitoxin [bacterium]HQO37119.1 CopG family antitoxin [bacterium]HQP97598.1 CopG family antitoxin [bacterium]
MKAKEFDRRFEAGEDLTGHLDLSGTRRLNLEQRRVNVDFPIWMIQSLDKEAERLGIPRQSLIKMLVAEHIKNTRA